MPIPNPSKDEEQDDFISRCMGNPAMSREYPDQEQRAAVCHSSWRKSKAGSLSASIGFTPLSIESAPPKEAPTRILLLNEGDLQWENLTGYSMDEKQAGEIIAEFLEHGTQLPVDYEHMTLSVDEIGGKAPAAGWIKKLDWVPGQGLMADVEWTPQARMEIESGQYKYHSPVIITDEKKKKIMRLHSVALTNTPRTKNQRELLAASIMKVLKEESNKGENTMDLKALKAALMLAEDATDEAILAAAIEHIKSTKTAKEKEAESIGLLAAKLGADKGSTLEILIAKADELRAGTVPASEYKAVTARLEGLEKAAADRESQELVAASIEAAKLNPHDEKQMAWARDYAKSDRAGFKKWSDSAPVLYHAGRLITASPKLDSKDDRQATILAAKTEYSENRDRLRGIEPWAYVNAELSLKGMEGLTADEKKALKGN